MLELRLLQRSAGKLFPGFFQGIFSLVQFQLGLGQRLFQFSNGDFVQPGQHLTFPNPLPFLHQNFPNIAAAFEGQLSAAGKPQAPLYRHFPIDRFLSSSQSLDAGQQ